MSSLTRHWFYWSLIGISFHAQFLCAQPKVRFDHIGINEGLSHSDVFDIVQDSRGFVWIATNKGVDRYDGHKIKNYPSQPDNPYSLSQGRVRRLYLDMSGDLWIGTESRGINFYDRVKDRMIPVTGHGVLSSGSASYILSNSGITSIASWKNKIFVGTLNNGLFVITHDSHGQFTAFDRIPIAENGSFEFDVNDMRVSSRGEVLIATESNGLMRLQGGQSLVRTKFIFNTVRALFIDKGDNIWVSTPRELHLLQGCPMSSDKFGGIAGSRQLDANVNSIFCDSFSRVWIGTSQGLFMLSPSNEEQRYVPESLMSHGEMRIFQQHDSDPEGLNSSNVLRTMEGDFKGIWIATEGGGVNRLNMLSERFDLLKREAGANETLASNFVHSIYKENADFLWITTHNGISRYDLRKKTYTNYLTRESDGDVIGVCVTSMLYDSNGNFWFGTGHDGLYRMQQRAGKDVLEQFSNMETIKGNRIGVIRKPSINYLAEDNFGYIWGATGGRGLYKFDKRGNVIHTYNRKKDNLPTDNFAMIYMEKKSGLMWVSSPDAGLLKFSVKKDSLILMRQFTHDSTNVRSLSVNGVWAIKEDHRHNLWIGTMGGGLHLLKRDGTKEYIVRYNKTVPESDIESIEEDSDGNLWIGGTGLIKFNPRDNSVVKFDATDGLQSNSFKINASYADRDGTLYFGGIHGLTSFVPESIKPNPYAPGVVFTGLRIFNTPVQVDEKVNDRVLLEKDLNYIDKIDLLYNESDFSIDFVGLHFSNPARNVYAYKLEGFHTRWIYPPEGQLTATFTNLSPGSYTFLVKARSRDGVWLKKPASLKINILPPWWRTWWAQVIYFVVALGVIAVYFKVRQYQGRLHDELIMQKALHQKDRELNSLKLRFFTSISHELRTPLTLIAGPLDEMITVSPRVSGLRDKVVLMHQQVRKLLNLVNQLMDFQKVESSQLSLQIKETDIVKFAYEIFLFFRLKAEEFRLEYTFNAVPDAVKLYIDQCKIEIAIVNLLSNAFKYTTERGGIYVSISITGDLHGNAVYDRKALVKNFCQITIQDTGAGIDAQELDKIFDPYYQASHTETLKIAGTGIGLAVVKSIVDYHSGEISVVSKVGEGTGFMIRLPLGKAHLRTDFLESNRNDDDSVFFKVPDLSATQEYNFLQADEARIVRDARLLIVEDNRDIANFIESMFRGMMQVASASNGHEGFLKALEFMPDVVLSDVMMPDVTGLELCRRIKAHPQTMHVPVLLLTARAASVHELEGFESGADDYITKPFNPSLLKTKVISIILNRHRVQEFFNKQVMLEPATVDVPDKDKEFLEMSMRIVEDHIDDPSFNVQGLVREAAMSQSVFYRRIKNATGLSAVEFIRDVRLRRAAQLLMRGDMKVSEISQRAGFDDVKYFRKVFLQRYQMTPAEFAKRNLSPLQ